MTITALALYGGSAQAGWQDVPDSLQLQAIGDSLIVNGIPMQVRAFTSDQPMETLLREVTKSWEAHIDHQPVERKVAGAWTVLNQTVGERHRSIQVRPSGPDSVEGFVALTSPKLARAPQLSFRLPAQVTAVSVIDSVDQGHVSQQVLAVSRRSPDATVAALEQMLKAEGWQRHVLRKENGAVRFSANKGEQQFDAHVSPQRAGSLLMINTLKN